MDDLIFKVKDSVDLFLCDGSYLMVYFMNSRQRKSFRINNGMIHLLENIDGEKNVRELKSEMLSKYGITAQSVENTLLLLKKHRIITTINENEILEKNENLKYSRQINYFSEFLESEEAAYLAQKKIMDTKVAVFGCGAVGGNIALQLAMAGVQNFILYDYDEVNISDIARHLYFRNEYLGEKKVFALKNELQKINSKISIECICEGMKPNSNLEEIIKNSQFVINTLDEPYIGYTASKISRVCIKYNIAHYIAGGFDAHLASTGELVIPYITPCVECYANHFKIVLKDWKPKKHPVKERYNELGGLACMSLFSSSYACIEILKYLSGIVNIKENYKVRGEFLFNDMSLTYLDIEKDPNCIICGGKENVS